MPEHFMVLIHVIAAIILIGPVMVATSQFPKAAQAAHNGDQELLHPHRHIADGDWVGNPLLRDRP